MTGHRAEREKNRVRMRSFGIQDRLKVRQRGREAANPALRLDIEACHPLRLALGLSGQLLRLPAHHTRDGPTPGAELRQRALLLLGSHGQEGRDKGCLSESIARL